MGCNHLTTKNTLRDIPTRGVCLDRSNQSIPLQKCTQTHYRHINWVEYTLCMLTCTVEASSETYMYSTYMYIHVHIYTCTGMLQLHNQRNIGWWLNNCIGHGMFNNRRQSGWLIIKKALHSHKMSGSTIHTYTIYYMPLKGYV